MKIVKSFLIISIVITTFLFISSCLSNQEGQSSDTHTGKGNKSEKIELNIIVTKGTYDEDTWQELMEGFKNKYPHIQINPTFYEKDEYFDKIDKMAAEQSLPDLISLWINPGHFNSITERGLVKDLSSILEGKEDLFVSNTFGNCVKNGKIYYLPATFTTLHVMYANQALLAELGLSFPKTFDELLEQGKIIREAGYTPISMTNKEGWQAQAFLLSLLSDRYGGDDWLYKALEGKEASFVDNDFVKALKIIKTMYDNQLFTPNVNSTPYGKSLEDFVNEKAVYLLDGGWRVGDLNTNLSESQKNHISFHVFPDITGQKGTSGSSSFVPNSGFGMNAKLTGEKQEAAWKWIWYFAGPEGAKIFRKHGYRTTYKVTNPASEDQMIRRFYDFLNSRPYMGTVIDAHLDYEGMTDVLHPDIKEMLSGNLSAEEAALNFENWLSDKR